MPPTVDAGDDQTIFIGENAQLNGTTDGITYEWTPTESLDDPAIFNPMASPTETTTYTLWVTNDDGCRLSDTVTVEVLDVGEIYIPNGFSPNGDNNNDELFVINHGIEELLVFEIYNRWGQVIYSSTDINAGWDGTYKGKDQEVGTYVYLVKVLTPKGETLSARGNVTLLR